MKCSSQADLHRRMADVYDFCKGTVFEGREFECIRIKGYDAAVEISPWFPGNPKAYDFALGIVEDKLVWEGNSLYFDDTKITVDAYSNCTLREWNAAGKVSWDPPKPKTVSISVNGEEPVAWRYRGNSLNSAWCYVDYKPVGSEYLIVEPLYSKGNCDDY